MRGVSANWVKTVQIFLIMTGDEMLLNKIQDMRQTILQTSLRPNRYTFKLLCEGYVKMKEADLALGAFDNMRKTAGKFRR